MQIVRLWFLLPVAGKGAAQPASLEVGTGCLLELSDGRFLSTTFRLLSGFVARGVYWLISKSKS